MHQPISHSCVNLSVQFLLKNKLYEATSMSGWSEVFVVNMIPDLGVAKYSHSK